jgi:hypothetical protein
MQERQASDDVQRPAGAAGLFGHAGNNTASASKMHQRPSPAFGNGSASAGNGYITMLYGAIPSLF